VAKPWIRLYRDALNNPKIGTLGLEATGMWAICLMLSDDEGVLPDDKGIAWASRYHIDAVTEMMAILLRNGLVTRYGNGYKLHDWSQHQRASDYDVSGAERQKRFRENQKAQKSAVTDSNALRNEPVTLPDTDTDTDKILPSVVSRASGSVVVRDLAAPVPRRAKALPPDFVIPFTWITDAISLREGQGKGAINYGAEAERFVNHFVANGKVMKDWRRAWLNWATSPYVDKLNQGGSNGKPNRAGETLGALFEGIARDRDRGEV
jgi:hypothetical protein